ncbi:MAG: PQQ-like domain [Aeromicrobium sp.]|jgi:hypothetical protein|nr:PQQ-like domain [Aeromicrobium sp.]
MGIVTRARRRGLGVLAAVLLSVSLTACGGGGEISDKKVDSTADPVRWPRYWATDEQAETGSQDVAGTGYFAGYDDAAVVYNGQDVVRFLDPATGKTNHPAVTIKSPEIVCGAQPRRQIENHRALLLEGVEGESCKELVAYDTQTGKEAWDFGFPEGGHGTLTTDQRDGTVLFASGDGYLVGLDAASGDVAWKSTAADYVLAGKSAKVTGCSTSAALAADRPVIIASLSCSAPSPQGGVWGIDLATGKELWHDDSSSVSPDADPHPIDGRLLMQREKGAAWVSSKSGKITKLAIKPATQRLEQVKAPFAPCDDMQGGSRGSPNDTSCIWSNGKTLVLATTMTYKNQFGMQLEGLDPASAKSLWTWKKVGEYDPDKHEFSNGFAPIGFTEDGKEFRVISNQETVLRFSAKDGNVVGRGTLAPGMNLVQLGVSGPGFLLLRRQGGILDAKSGLSYYRTES